MARSRLVGVLVVVLAGALVLTACGGQDTPPTPARTSASQTSDVTPSPIRPEPSNYQICGYTDGQFSQSAVQAEDPDSPKYTGAGPHPVLLYQGDDAELNASLSDLPADWQPSPSHPAQLTVCQYIDDSYTGQLVGTCPYQDSDGTDSTAKVMSARYVFRVFEARTGALVTQFTLVSSSPPEEVCPVRTVGSATEFFQEITASDLITALRPIVEGSHS